MKAIPRADKIPGRKGRSPETVPVVLLAGAAAYSSGCTPEQIFTWEIEAAIISVLLNYSVARLGAWMNTLVNGVEFICSRCLRLQRISRRLAGRLGLCPACGQSTAVWPYDPLRDGPPPELPSEVRQSSSPRKRLPSLLIGLFCGLLVTVAFWAAGWLWSVVADVNCLPRPVISERAGNYLVPILVGFKGFDDGAESCGTMAWGLSLNFDAIFPGGRLALEKFGLLHPTVWVPLLHLLNVLLFGLIAAFGARYGRGYGWLAIGIGLANAIIAGGTYVLRTQGLFWPP